MKSLKRNQQTFYYYMYKDKIPKLDDYGNKTGEYTLIYHRAKECKGNISAGNGNSQVELFGNDINYNKVIVIDNPNCEINEFSLLCIDINPQYYDVNSTPAHDYIVKGIARSLNSVSIAIGKVKADEIEN